MQGPVQITARGAHAGAKRAAAALDADPRLESVAYALLEEDEARSLWRLDIYPGSDEEAQAILGLLTVRGELRVACAPLADADWLAMALSGLPPVRAGRFFVYGAHDRGRVPTNAVALRIEAGAAFGTGHHGTTLGCLAALDRQLKRRRFERVLDVGTGAGVLAIAAARTGASIAVGTDIDPVSVRIARENAKINGVSRAQVRFVRADGLAARAVAASAPYDLVLANILAGPLVRLAPSIHGALRPGGVAVLSGLLRGQARAVAAAYLARGFRLERREVRDAWVTQTLVRR